MIEKKIAQDLRQPRFHIGCRIELFVSSEGANKSLLDQILGVRCIFCQIERHPIQMIEVNHGLTCNSVLFGASCFSLSGHAGILIDESLSKQHNVLPASEFPMMLEQRQ
jgi:hypothetical protein